MSPRRGYLSLHPDLAGAGLLWLFGACGIAVSVLLTLLKFRSVHACDESLLSACQIGGLFSCQSVLQSEWSTVLTDVPISILATAYYAVLLGLATAVLSRPMRFLAIARPLLLALGWVGLLIVPPLFLYAVLHVQSLCSYCCVVYLLNIGIFLVVWWMNPEGPIAGLAALFAPSIRRRGSTLMFAGLSFVALVMVQTLKYRQGAAAIEAKGRCLREGELPGTGLRLVAAGVEEPEAEVALFVDLACPACKREFRKWQQHVEQRPGRYELTIYHFPREGACVPPGDTSLSGTAAAHESCRAARAVECALRRRPDLGMALVGRLFDVQDEGREPYFTRERVGAVVAELGIAAADDAAFQDCFENDAEVLRRVREHVKFAAEQGLTETPGAFFGFYDEDHNRLPKLFLTKGAKDYPDLDEFVDRARRKVVAELAKIRTPEES